MAVELLQLMLLIISYVRVNLLYLQRPKRRVIYPLVSTPDQCVPEKTNQKEVIDPANK